MVASTPVQNKHEPPPGAATPAPPSPRQAPAVGLCIPEITAEDDAMSAAIKYAKAGLYVVPVKSHTKHPGSVLGDGWQMKSTRDVQEIVALWAGTDHGVGIHAGRSGLVIFDIDHPEVLPEALARAAAEEAPPFQQTRRGQLDRGHLIFRVPPGRVLGNGRGQLYDSGQGPGERRITWGEVRGLNGFVMAEPSPHPDDAGEYHWSRIGLVPVLPDYVDTLLPTTGERDAPATDADVEAFMVEHSGGTHPHLMRAPLDRFLKDVGAGGSRHESLVAMACWIARDARARLYDAHTAFSTIESQFLDAVAAKPTPGRHPASEFRGAVAWAVAQVTAPGEPTPAEHREAVLTRLDKPTQADLDAWLAVPNTPTTPASTTATPTDLEPNVVESPESLSARAFELLVQEEERRQAAREEATRRLRARQAGALAMPVPVRGDAFLAIADEPVEYRIDRILPIGSRALMAAPAKAGKTTFMGNLVRCLVDGDRFLDAFDVVRPQGGVLVIDDELDERMLRRWTREQGINRTDQLHFIALRGQVSTFNILDESTRALWAATIRATGATFVVLDCLRPVLDALGLSEDKDAGRFLVALDALMTEAGVPEFVVVHHTGHAGERSRGDSRLVDWPDVLWRLVRQKDENGTADMAAPRFFTAFGRDVDVPEGLLAFEAEGRRLAYSATSRSAAAGAAALPAVLALLEQHAEGLSGRAIEEAAPNLGASRDAVRKALAAGRAEGSITCVPGPRRATLHVRSIPTVSRSL